MKKLILTLLFSFVAVYFIVDQTQPKFKYSIVGKIYIPTSGTSGLHNHTWQCNKYFFVSDTVCYISENADTVKIDPPYKIKKNF